MCILTWGGHFQSIESEERKLILNMKQPSTTQCGISCVDLDFEVEIASCASHHRRQRNEVSTPLKTLNISR